MFNKKELQEIKDLIENNHKQTNQKIDLISETLSHNIKDVSELRSMISRSNHEFVEKTNQLEIELEKIITLSDNFSRCVNSFDSMKHKISDLIQSKISEMLDKETANINSKLESLNNIEEEFTSFMDEVNSIKEQLSKFNKISKEIKEVDFTLDKHTSLIQKIEKRKIHLEDENDKLKSLLAKMKRNRR
ncbi:hypothetical protein KY321_04770 [Candidatus Woesearchaeota archaeon]|nr:hypothetical protein [Candidatus Woesearchaeota archaeon]